MGRRKFHFKKKLPMQSNIQLTAYQLNKIAYAKMPVLVKESAERETAKQKLITYITNTPGHYYMLLNHNINDPVRYYTVFHIDSQYPEHFLDVFEECVDNIGELIDIEFVEDTNTCEVWVRKDNDTSMYVFFNYDLGVVECQL